MGSVKDGQWITDLLDYYKIKSFYSENGDLDTTTIVKIITDFLNNDKGLFINNTIQNIDGYCKIYPRDYFYPKDIETKNNYNTQHSLYSSLRRLLVFCRYVETESCKIIYRG